MTSSNWKIPFGKKYKGMKIGLVPANYLLWVAENTEVAKNYPNFREYVDQNYRVLKLEAAESGDLDFEADLSNLDWLDEDSDSSF